MTLEDLIFLFIPKNLFFQGANPSKVALPCSKTLLKVKTREDSEVLLMLSVCWRGESTPPIYTRV